MLDDVDKQEQLNALVGDPVWFWLRSIIIITTRNKHLLYDDMLYAMENLNNEKAIELFSWHAF